MATLRSWVVLARRSVAATSVFPAALAQCNRAETYPFSPLRVLLVLVRVEAWVFALVRLLLVPAGLFTSAPEKLGVKVETSPFLSAKA